CPPAHAAEGGFYEALEAADLEAMVAVWAEDEDIVGVHPGGPRLAGFEQVRGSWAQILGSGQRLKVQVTHQVVLSSMMLAIHSVHENITVEGESRPPPPVPPPNPSLPTRRAWHHLL